MDSQLSLVNRQESGDATFVRPTRTGSEPTAASMKALPGYLYMGSPYSKWPAGQEDACLQACRAAANLMLAGFRIFSPIAHSHPIGVAGQLDNLDWNFWRDQDRPLMVRAAGMVVICLTGWRESVGLGEEIEYFAQAMKPILYLTPQEAGL